MKKDTVKEEIEKLLLSTNRKGIKDLIKFLNKTDFYKARCCRHHNYDGGTAKHSLEVYKILKEKDCGIPEDSKIIISILHDLCDIRGFYKIYGHGRRSVILTYLIKGGFRLTPLERKLIRWHMYTSHPIGEKEEKEEKEVKQTKEWSAVKNADFLSSFSDNNKLCKVIAKLGMIWI